MSNLLIFLLIVFVLALIGLLFFVVPKFKERDESLYKLVLNTVTEILEGFDAVTKYFDDDKGSLSAYERLLQMAQDLVLVAEKLPEWEDNVGKELTKTEIQTMKHKYVYDSALKILSSQKVTLTADDLEILNLAIKVAVATML